MLADNKDLIELLDVVKQHIDYSVISNKEILNLCQAITDKVNKLELRVSQLEDLHRLEEHKDEI